MANTHNSKARLRQKKEKNEGKKVTSKGLAGIRTRVAGSKVGRSTNWATGAEKKFGPKIDVFVPKIRKKFP